FFQAEDGIRDLTVTGVQTCALPISFHDIKTIIEVKDEIPLWMIIGGAALLILLIVGIIYLVKYLKRRKKPSSVFKSKLSTLDERSEERRVGKECRYQ